MANGRATMRFTVEQYHEMGRAGILSGDMRTELIDGEVVMMSPVGPEHAACVKRVTRLFHVRLGDRATVSVQDPVVLDAYWEPQPDVSLLAHRDDFYAAGHPEPSDILLAIEVADTTLKNDREVKIPHYAATGVRESWIVDLNGERVEVHRRPTKSGYRSIHRLGRGEKISPLAFPDVSISVNEILGAR